MVGIIAWASEVTVALDPNKFYQSVVAHYADGRMWEICDRHEILVVQLDSCEEYVVDLAEAQYGQYSALMALDEYKARYVQHTFRRQAGWLLEAMVL